MPGLEKTHMNGRKKYRHLMCALMIGNTSGYYFFFFFRVCVFMSKVKLTLSSLSRQGAEHSPSKGY